MRKNTSAVDSVEREWSLISVNSQVADGVKTELLKTVKKEANIEIEKIETVSSNYYFARLTDNNVNNIKRDEFQLLNFFTASEANELLLTVSTKQFLNQHSNLI